MQLNMKFTNVPSSERVPITKQQLVDQLKSLSVQKGDLLHVKVSMKSLGPVDGGASALLDALLEVVGPEGTLVVDAFSKSFRLPFSSEARKYVSDNSSDTYTGYFNQVFIKHPSMVRSRHPIQKFAAIGALAHELMDNHTSFSLAYDVLEKMAKKGAKNLNVGERIIGVATTHVAIEETKLKKHNFLQGVNYLDVDGQVKFFKVNWMGGCSKGCTKYVPEYEKQGFVTRGVVGYAGAMLTNMQGTLSVDRQMIARDPSSFFCDDPTCKDCRLRWDHSTGNWWSVKFFSFKAIVRRWFKGKSAQNF